MAARLYFAVATAYQHEIYLIDELLSVGDEHFQSKCWQRMRERLLCGASGVLVTHDWTAILKLCEKACVIDNGIFAYVGSSDGAVVNYLKLVPLTANSVRFSKTLRTEYIGNSGAPLKIDIPVEILNAGITTCSISIEMMRIGVGWEIIMLSPSVMVGESVGDYLVCFEIQDLPLVPGIYSLNIFLTHPRSKEGDVRSWTYGNGLSLKIDGTLSEAAVQLPYIAKILNEVQ
jgi:lipopolysaccharide transport system ATP-binding protein